MPKPSPTNERRRIEAETEDLLSALQSDFTFDALIKNLDPHPSMEMQ